MTNPTKPKKNALLKQALLTAGLVALFLGTLQVASQNKNEFGDDEHSFPIEDFENNQVMPEKAPQMEPANAPFVCPIGDFSGCRTLIAGERAAELTAPADAKVFRLLKEKIDGVDGELITADLLVDAEPFERIIVTHAESRPPKRLAQKIAKGGYLYVLKSDDSWRCYQEEAGRLAPRDKLP